MAWAGSAVNVPMILVSVGFLLLGVAVLLIAHDAAGFAIASAGPLLAVWAVARVEISSEAVTIRLGWLRWPRRTTPLASVVTASVGWVRPRHYGGWGLRGRAGTMIYLIRGGPALRLELRDGAKVLITVDRPEGAVRAVRAALGNDG